MAKKYKNKYRTESTRLQTWDYGWSAAYFITICTKNRKHFFGEIIDGKMYLSKIGKMVKIQWLKTFELRPDMNLQMGEFVVMPNHFHGVVIIGKNKYNSQYIAQRRDAMHCVSTANPNTANPNTANPNTANPNTANPNTANPNKNKFGPQSKNLASIIRGFKSSVTTYARKNNFIDFGWQTKFHDHIIRDGKSFENISNYIINNPQKWSEDMFWNK